MDYLHIVAGDDPQGWHDDINSTEWLAFFRLFPTVKTLHIFGTFAVQIARALEDVPGEIVTEVFPSLQSLISQGPDSEEPPYAEQFVSSRRLHGCPVTIFNWRVEEL